MARAAEVPIPSRAALLRAEQANTEAGHENLGFLSESHGFMPKEPPPLALPSSHRTWDELAAELPQLWRTATVREAISSLPILSARELPEADLWRASCLLSILAHCYVRAEALENEAPPAPIGRPWAELTERLGRPKPYLAYNDLIVYNWRLLDPNRPDPMRVENLDLLVPTVGNEEERVFYLTQVEIIAQCAPLVGTAVRAQEAVVRDDAAALKEELLLILERLRHVTEISFQKIDPNPLSATAVDPVVWANTVAPFAVPITEKTAGPSGTAAPVFHLLDCFFSRRHFKSRLGEEIYELRPWFPPQQRAFLEAVDELSVADYVRKSGDRELQGLFSTAFEAYVGPKGYLGTHRLKVYGFLELAFKVGRSVTITGFSGAFKDRAWKDVDQELENTRRERYLDRWPHVQQGVLTHREGVGSAPEGLVQRVVLGIEGAGVLYRPGDRCHVLPENREELVERTLSALHAKGDERVPLTTAWREASRLRPGHEPEPVSELPLADFLRYAKLRPLLRSVGKALLAVTASDSLDEILEARHEDQWELWEALKLVAAEGYDTRRLWRSELWHDEAIARIVPPEPFRSYSVSSAPDGRLPQQLELTVGRLEYRSSGGRVDGVQRRGTASTYLMEAAEGNGRLSLEVVRPSRFRLPDDPGRAIVMFAGGTGISPFRGFLQERASADGENWLFFGTRTRDELYYEQELEALVAAGRLDLRVAFSREDASARSTDGRLVVGSGPRARLPDVLESEDNAAELWRLLRDREEGGAGAYIYICGRADFAQSVMQSLVRIVAGFAPDDGSEREEWARAFIRQLVADRRYMQDVFTTFAPHTAPGVLGAALYDASDVALHNDNEHGYWLVIDGNVYDMTEFMHLHPGGPKIIRENVGLDATREYRAVLHHESSEVDAMLAMYKTGAIRRLDFGSTWGIALVPGEGIAYVSLRDLFRNWVRYLYVVVEMENALRNDFSYLVRPLTRRDEDPRELNALKLLYAASTHKRFLEGYFDGALGEDLQRLFALTVGLCAPAERINRLERELAAVRDEPEAQALRNFSERALSFYRELADRDRPPAAETVERMRRFCAVVEEHDRRFLAELKLALCEGVRVFEELEAATLDEGSERIVDALLAIPGIARSYCSRLAEEARELAHAEP